MKKNRKKKFRIGCIFSIITSLIMISVSLQPLGDIDRFSRLIMLVPLSIAAWLFFLGRENVFDLTYTGGRHDIYDEDYVDDTEGGFLEHCIEAAFVFVPLCAIDTFIFFGHSIAKGLYWLVPVVLIILNIIEIMPEKKPSKDDKNKTTELAAKDVDEKSSALKNIEVIKVEGAGSQYYFDFHSQSLILYNILSYDIYKIEGNTIKNKLYHIAGERKNESLSMTNKDGNLVGLSNNVHNIPTRNNHEIVIDGKIKYKIIDNTSTAPYDNYIITDPDGNKLAYYQILNTDTLRRKNIYGPNDEPYVTWSDDKTFSVMESCPIDDKSVILMIASVLSDSAVQVL